MIAQTGVTVSGSVQDPSGAVIPGATVTLISKSSHQTLAAKSNGEGRFAFTNVASGEYVLKSEAQGFNRFEKPVSVQNQALTDIPVTMPISAAEEEVEVSASGSRPDAPENNADALNVNADFLAGLPSQSQDILPVVSNFLSPAAQGVEGTSIVVDGVESSTLTEPTDAIKRVYINKDPYSAEFRRPGSGRLDVTTRNGSRSHFDGKLALYDRNDIFDARNAIADEKPNLDRRLWEATLGGPLPINHARFFLSASRLSNDEDAIVNATTPQGQLIQNVPTAQITNSVSARADFKPVPDHTLTVLYSFHNNPRDNQDVGGLQLPEHATTSDSTQNKLKLSYTTAGSATFMNVVRFNFEREHERIGGPASAPELDVSGAFLGGANPSAFTEDGTRMEIQDVINYVHGSHILRAGAAFLPKFFTDIDSTNFGGIFTFPDLSAFNGHTPVLFQTATGNPNLSFTKHEAYGFIQDTTNFQSHISLMLGLRYDWQEHLTNHTNFGPRVAVGYAPGGGKTVFRAGAGIFYDRLSDHVMEQVSLLDGTQEKEFIVRHPFFPVASLSGAKPSLWLLDPKAQSPYLFQASLSVEHPLFRTLRGTLEYRYLRGVHLFRALDVNAPLDGVRPDPNLFLERLVESTGLLRSNALIASLQGRVKKALKFKAQYTFSRSDDNTDGPLALPADSRNLGPEWGRSSFDMRHRFVVAGTAELPAAFKLGLMVVANSGAPFNITTGSDDNDDGIANDRPPGVTRNTGDGPAFMQTDLRVSKIFNFFKGPLNSDGDVSGFTKMELSFDAFNLFNHTNLTNIIGEVSSPRFGQATNALAARTIQMSLRFSFRGSKE
ncbi:MAG TPA: carboxypeptidase regulatory-like domain-containing protein [Verrucomicrobiae bacterium]|nr:carboxypeptidase regulatory-like domain-containing protein [Verrucomicrobiae bacterium]